MDNEFQTAIDRFYEMADTDAIQFPFLVGEFAYNEDDSRKDRTDAEAFERAIALFRHLLATGDFYAGKWTTHQNAPHHVLPFVAHKATPEELVSSIRAAYRTPDFDEFEFGYEMALDRKLL